MKLDQLLDNARLCWLMQEGYVVRRAHPTLPLVIFNYTARAQKDNLWGDGTIDYCRGLITDLEGNIVARPFKKFHNLNTSSIPETMEENLPKVEPKVTEKYDGSLGILYTYNGETAIATRGSFTSDQAKWATAWLKKNNTASWNTLTMQGWTPLFEIVYPENRIVVEYDYEGLVLIGVVDNETGTEMLHQGLVNTAEKHKIRCAQLINPLSVASLKSDETPNREGFVLTYDLGNDCSPLKVKVKLEEYTRLHRMVTGMNPRSVWEILSTDGDLGRFQNTPAPFKRWLGSWVERQLHLFFNIKERVEIRYRLAPSLNQFPDRRMYKAAVAKYYQETGDPYSSAFFARCDGRDINPIIWKMVEPAGNDTTFRTEGE